MNLHEAAGVFARMEAERYVDSRTLADAMLKRAHEWAHMDDSGRGEGYEVDDYDVIRALSRIVGVDNHCKQGGENGCETDSRPTEK